MGLTGLKSGCRQSWVSSGGSESESIPVSRGHMHFLAHGPPLPSSDLSGASVSLPDSASPLALLSL